MQPRSASSAHHHGPGTGLSYIRAFYMIERELKGKPPEDRFRAG